jgi:hypothetical protein
MNLSYLFKITKPVSQNSTITFAELEFSFRYEIRKKVCKFLQYENTLNILSDLLNTIIFLKHINYFLTIPDLKKYYVSETNDSMDLEFHRKF